MKERIAQLKARYQNYSAREKIILKIFILVLPHFLQMVLNIFIDIKIHLKQTLKFTL